MLAAIPDEEWAKWSGARERIVTGIGSPLGFFVLALLIVEGFLLGAGSWFNLPSQTRIELVWAAVILFVFVVSLVAFLVIKYPQSLVFTERSHLQMAGLQIYGDKSRPLSPEMLENTMLTRPPQPPNPQLPQAGGPDVGAQ